MTDSDSDDKPDDAEREQAHAGSQGTDAEAHGGHGADQSGASGDAQAGSGQTPGPAGYKDRDPKSEMPRVPGHPETEDDAVGEDEDEDG